MPLDTAAYVVADAVCRYFSCSALFRAIEVMFRRPWTSQGWSLTAHHFSRSMSPVPDDGLVGSRWQDRSRWWGSAPGLVEVICVYR